MKNKTMQEMNEQYRDCPAQVNVYEVNGRTNPRCSNINALHGQWN